MSNGMGLYRVRYAVEGFGEQIAGPFRGMPEARGHYDDIKGFEGVTDCCIEELDPDNQEVVVRKIDYGRQVDLS